MSFISSAIRPKLESRARSLSDARMRLAWQPARQVALQAVQDVQPQAPVFDVASATAATTHQSLPTASVTRILFNSSRPNTRLRTLLSSRLAGPLGILVVAGYVFSLAHTAWRYFVVDKSRDCPDCRGYSITRCDLCEGAGAISWEGKWGHVEPCPQCLGRRHVRCPTCGGLHARKLFAHTTRQGGMASVLSPAYATSNPASAKGGDAAGFDVTRSADQLAACKHDLVFD